MCATLTDAIEVRLRQPANQTLIYNTKQPEFGLRGLGAHHCSGLDMRTSPFRFWLCFHFHLNFKADIIPRHAVGMI